MNKLKTFLAAAGVVVLLGLAVFSANARPIAAAQLQDGIVILTDDDFGMCPEGTKLAIAKDNAGSTMPGCWTMDEKEENVVIVWISPPMRFPSGGFSRVPEDLGS